MLQKWAQHLSQKIGRHGTAVALQVHQEEASLGVPFPPESILMPSVINQGHLLPQAAVPPQLLRHSSFVMRKSDHSTPYLG